jgi:hypothetical protein
MEMTRGGGVRPDLDPRERERCSSTILPILAIDRPEAELFLDPRELAPTFNNYHFQCIYNTFIQD